jgi:DNA-binding response OmpR family regulator
MKILVVDDDADLLALIGFTLNQAGFEVRTAHDGAGALRAFEHETPDFVLLDVNMPEPNGLDVCREIRNRSPVPIMMLTVRDQEEDLLAAFDCGADDYVRKPFSPRALLARVRALIRRAEPLNLGSIAAGNLHLDLEQHTLRIGAAEPLRLTPLELKALHLLMTSPGRTVTAERLLVHVWGRSTSRERRTLKQLIYRLRQKLEEEDSAASQVLQTTPGAGYKLVVD